MDYSRRELADALAAEYVIGTMRGAARSCPRIRHCAKRRSRGASGSCR
jgi:anti-sigma-K factor RskA